MTPSWPDSNFSRVYHESTEAKTDKITLFCPEARKDERSGKDLWRVSLPNNRIRYSRADNSDVGGQRGNILVQDVTLYTAPLNVFEIRYVMYNSQS